MLGLKFLLGLGLAALVLDNPDSLIEELPSLLRLAGQDFLNLSLTDDGVALLADTRVVEELVYVLEADGGPVDQVLGLAGPVDPPGDGHFFIIHRQGVVGVVNREGHIRKRKGPPVLGPFEDDIGHRGAPELLSTLLA